MTPINESGIVSKMINGRRIELNFPTSSSTMMSPPTGSFSTIERFPLPEVSNSPPRS